MADERNKDGQSGGVVSPVRAALLGLCPRCGTKTLFDGPASFASKCTGCSLDFSAFNVGDGPAAFLTLIIGALITVLALWLEFAVQPPMWVHALLWIPVTIAAVLWGLRMSKAALLQAEYRRRAGEAGGKDVTTPNKEQDEF